MTFKEFGVIADTLKTFYPKDNLLPTEKAIELWFDMLKDLDYKTAAAGLKKHISVSRFPPTIADIRAGAEEFTNPQELHEQEAWALVANAIRNSGYNSVEEFEKLPPLVQKAVGQPSQLRYWALDNYYNEAKAKESFQRAFRIEAAREKELSKMPLADRKWIEDINLNSYKAQIEQKNERLIKVSSEEKQSQIKALETLTEGVPMAIQSKEKLVELLEEVKEDDGRTGN